MPVWNKCPTTMLFADKRQALKEDYEVEINDKEITVTVSDEEVWQGANDGTGHYLLSSDEYPESKAYLHLRIDESALEGSWEVEDDQGMWIIELGGLVEGQLPAEVSKSRKNTNYEILRSPSFEYKWSNEQQCLVRTQCYEWNKCRISLTYEYRPTKTFKDCTIYLEAGGSLHFNLSDDHQFNGNFSAETGVYEMQVKADEDDHSSPFNLSISDDSDLLEGMYCVTRSSDDDTEGVDIKIEIDGLFIHEITKPQDDLKDFINKHKYFIWRDCILETEDKDGKKYENKCNIFSYDGDLVFEIDGRNEWEASTDDGFRFSLTKSDINGSFGELIASCDGSGLEGIINTKKWRIIFGTYEEARTENLRKPTGSPLTIYYQFRDLVLKILNSTGAKNITEAHVYQLVAQFSKSGFEDQKSQEKLVDYICESFGQGKKIRSPRSKERWYIPLKATVTKGSSKGNVIDFAIFISFKDIDGNYDISLCRPEYLAESPDIRAILGI